MATRSRSFTRTTLATLGAGALALLVVIGSSLWLANEARSSATRVSQAGVTRLHAFRLLIVMQDAETGQRGYLLTGKASYLQPYLQAHAQAAAELAQLRDALAAEGRSGELVDTASLVAAKFAELDETVGLARQGLRARALAVVDTDRGKEFMDRLRIVTDRMIVASDVRVTRETSTLLSDARTLTAVSLVGGILVVAFVFAAGWTALAYTRELLQAQEEVRALNADLEGRVSDRTADLSRANEEIQRFAYIVSHDLRAPLVNVMGFTSELEEGLAVVGRYFGAPPDHREAAVEAEAQRAALQEMPEAIEFVRSSTRKMDSLINAILKISREGGRLLSPEPVDLAAVMERQGNALRHQFDAAGAAFRITDPLPVVVSDRLALEQVFGNLIDNAVKYLGRDRPGLVEVSSRDLGSRVEIAIQDNGRGIAAQDFERIFELFRRSGSQDRPGEGIGLAHVRALVRRLGGEISVDSRLNEGSCFRVILPKTMVGASRNQIA